MFCVVSDAPWCSSSLRVCPRARFYLVFLLFWYILTDVSVCTLDALLFVSSPSALRHLGPIPALVSLNLIPPVNLLNIFPNMHYRLLLLNISIQVNFNCTISRKKSISTRSCLINFNNFPVSFSRCFHNESFWVPVLRKWSWEAAINKYQCSQRDFMLILLHLAINFPQIQYFEIIMITCENSLMSFSWVVFISFQDPSLVFFYNDRTIFTRVVLTNRQGIRKEVFFRQM